MNFNVFINSALEQVIPNSGLVISHNKSILSLGNQFEDGKWNFKNFSNFIWDNIKETALSHRERNALIQKGESSVLVEASKKLRLIDGNIGKGSEIAEILLYGIMKHHYSALPVVPKIFYKQNSNDNAKGMDSVHIVVTGADSFSLWFGESKFYDSIDDTRLGAIVASVKESLDLGKLKKENSIITNVSDLDDFDEINDDLRTKIKNALNQSTSIDEIKPILNIPILLLHECEITKRYTSLSKEYIEEIKNHHLNRAKSYFQRQLKACSGDIHMYEHINFHILLFPVFDKQEIVNKFVSTAKVFIS